MSDLELWHFIRAAGLLGYGLLWLSVALGVSVRTRALSGVLHRSWVYELHQTISVMALVATVVHIILVTQNVHVRIGLMQVLVPMSSSWQPWAVTLGLLGTYLSTLVCLSSLVRRWMSYSQWRFIHYAAFPAWVTALAHGVLAGSDSGLTWMTWIYALSAEAVFLLVVYRFFLVRSTARITRPVASMR